MNRAYSLIEVKSLDKSRRRFSGTATTPEMDRVGDTVNPLGAKFRNPVTLLHQHRHDAPIGTVKLLKPTAKGIEFEAEIPVIEEPGPLKDRVDTAWGEIVAGIVRAVSIGFRPLKYAFTDEGGIDFQEIEIFELSAVSIPANASAVIHTVKSMDRQFRQEAGVAEPDELPAPTTIKSIDRDALAASGRERELDYRRETPAASGTKGASPTTKQRRPVMAKTIAEQIAAFEAKRAANEARVADIMAKSAEELTTLDEADEAEHDELTAEIESIDKHLARLRKVEKLNVEKATPAAGANDDEGTKSRGGIRVEVKGTNLPKGTAFTRYAMALAKSKGNLMQAAQIAKQWDDTPEVETVLKAAVSAGTTTDSDWAAPLVPYNQMASEFIELLRPATILGRIPGLRRVPFNISMPKQTSGSTVGWVGENKPKPVSELAFGTETLRWAKAAGIVVLTDELVKFSNPAAEGVVRSDLIASMAQFLDGQLLDPSVAAVADVSPASLTNGVTPIIASGTDADAIRADLADAMEAIITGTKGIGGSVIVMSEIRAMRIASLRNPLGQKEFPDISAAGGTLEGLPVVTSESAPTNTVGSGSPPIYPAGDIITVIRAPEVYLADDGQVVLDASREASLQMNSTPDAPPTASTVLVSLWQHNLLALRAERWINWKKRRAGAVQYIIGSNYGVS